MYVFVIILSILIIYHLLNDNSPYIFQNILKIKIKNKPYISLKEMKDELKKTSNPIHIKELKRIIKNRRLFWLYFVLFVINFLYLSFRLNNV